MVEFQRPWGFPDHTNDRDPAKSGNYIETPQTVPGPYPQDAVPTVLFGTDGPASNRMRLDYERAGCPEQTDVYNEEFKPASTGWWVSGPLSGPKPGRGVWASRARTGT